MVKLALYAKTQNFFEYCESLELEKTIFVAPNPRIADIIRKRFESSIGKSIDSITISKFVKNEQTELLPELDPSSLKSKSELLLVLGAVWKKLNDQGDYIAFKKAFNLLTEFRSFSVADQVLETVLEYYDEELATGVLWLHRFIGQLEYVDEHKSYFLLAEKLREKEPPASYQTDHTIVFYGFDHLTASQVDMLKAYGLRSEVIIPFYNEAYEKSLHLDWINWFDEHNLEKVILGKEEEASPANIMTNFSRNYLGQELLNLNEKEKYQTIVLGTKNINREHFSEIPFAKLKTKFSVDLFEESYLSLTKMLAHMLSDKGISCEKLKAFLNDKSIELVKDENFKKLKCCLLYMQIINNWQELSTENIFITPFDFEIIKETVELDLPRVNMAYLNPHNDMELKSLVDIEGIKGEEVLFTLTSKYDSLKGVGANFSENVEKYLVSLGPIRRAELDRYVLKCKFKEFIQDNSVHFLVEEGLLEEDSNLSSLFSGVNLQMNPRSSYKKIDKSTIEFTREKYPLTSLSASKLQKYLDCPKKFYLSYALRFPPRIDLQSELSVLELGQVEHKVIENYFGSKHEWDEMHLEKTIIQVLNGYFASKEIENKNDYILEVKAYTQSAIKGLIKLRAELGLKMQFERAIHYTVDDLTYVGSIDLYAETDDTIFVIDFKRSNRLFTSYTSLLEYQQVQLWFYYKALSEMGIYRPEKNIVLGYIDLSHFENSLMFTSEKGMAGTLKKTLGWTKVKFLDEFLEVTAAYVDFEKELVTKLINDTEFKAEPLQSNACTFCAVKNICGRR